METVRNCTGAVQSGSMFAEGGASRVGRRRLVQRGVRFALELLGSLRDFRRRKKRGHHGGC